MQQFKHRDGGGDFGRVSGKANEDRSIIRHVETRKTSDEVSLVTDGEKKNAGVKSSKDGGRTQGRGGSASPDTSPSEASRKGARKGISASHASGKKGRAGGIAEAGRRSGGAVGGKAERSPAASKLTERRKSALSSISPDGKTRSSRGGLPRHKAGSLSLAGGRMERRGRIAKAVKTAEKVGDMAGNEATSRDWGDEMSGSAAHTAANGAKDVARKRGREALKGFRKGFQEGRAAGSAGGRAVAKRAASKAAIRRANVRKARKAAQAARAAQKAGTQAARTAGAGLVKQIVAIVAAGVQALVSALGAVLAPLLIAIIAIVLIITLFTSIFSVLSSVRQNRAKGASLEGMPNWVTYDLALACMEEHDKHGYPAGALLGQMIIENGAGDEGSSLGSEYHNYGGVKYAGYDYGGLIIGSTSMLTFERDKEGGYYQTYAEFAVFRDDAAFMEYRCEHLLAQDNYTSVPDYQRALQTNDSALFLRALGEGGYYTASQDEYVASFESLCDTYPLLVEMDQITTAEFKDKYDPAKHPSYSGGGADYASAEDWQKRIVDCCHSVGSPGAGLCAMWVSQVYSAAGMGYPMGNGNSMLAGYETSSDFSQIKVGQIVSAQYGSNSPAGNTYGHVGIYVGDGMIMDNTGSIETQPLSDWISDYSRGWVVYGWPW